MEEIVICGLDGRRLVGRFGKDFEYRNLITLEIRPGLTLRTSQHTKRRVP